MSDLPQIAPKELKTRLGSPGGIFVLDVRNPDEYAICKIPGSHLIPLAELSARLGELDKGAEIVVHCKMGGRSTQAQIFMQQNGFKNVTNLTGGILAWADQCDPSMARY